ncbi:MAG: hypothetical protein GF350_16385, partial [Chitinivibrionales bacterium]|nr:hypothetical protein [Chitinivibrionales bacterium]
MRPKHQPAVEKATAFIIHLVRSDENATMLPSLRELSEKASVSLQTMWKAVKILHHQGVLSGHGGRRFSVTQHGREYCKTHAERIEQKIPAQTPVQTAAWLKVMERIRQDVFSGIFLSGNALPSIKDLQLRYSTT